jgi:hypothetical protein
VKLYTKHRTPNDFWEKSSQYISHKIVIPPRVLLTIHFIPWLWPVRLMPQAGKCLSTLSKFKIDRGLYSIERGPSAAGKSTNGLCFPKNEAAEKCWPSQVNALVSLY